MNSVFNGLFKIADSNTLSVRWLTQTSISRQEILSLSSSDRIIEVVPLHEHLYRYSVASRAPVSRVGISIL